MADPDFSASVEAPDLYKLIDYFVDQLESPARVAGRKKAMKEATAEASAVAHALARFVLDPGLELLGKFLFRIEEHVESMAGPPLARLAGHLLGQDVSIADLRRAASASGEAPIGNAVAGFALNALRGPAGDIEPGDAGARRLLATLAQLVVNGWFEGTAFELITTLFPDMDAFDSVAKLPEDLIDALGLGRLARVALRPLAQHYIATPLDWQISKTHRPTLLAAGAAVRQFVRGRWTRAQLEEELARAGYSSDRIEALINAERKFFSVGDVRTFVDRQHWDKDRGLAHLKDQGYEEAAAEDALRLEGLRRIDQLEAQEASALVSAYANAEIDRSTFLSLLSASVTVDTERALITELAEVRRALHIKRLSASQADACVKAGILAVSDYREVLRRDGYNEADVLALELLLRHEMDKELAIEEHQQAAAAERAAEKKAREDAAAARKAQVEAERALHRRGALGDLERAVVRGLIPFARLEEVLGAQYDADTVAILVGLVEDQRQQYLDAQQRAADARQRAEVRNIDVGALEQAVLDNIVSLADFRRRLDQLHFAPADAEILAATLGARKQDLDDAKAKRAAAEEAAKRKSIDLGRAEQLVVRGVGTLAQYDALLASLGFDAFSRAAMEELLTLKVADAREAERVRDEYRRGHEAQALTLEQLRRAVILGVSTTDDYQRVLVSEKFTAEAQRVLLAELRADVEDAKAARQRRQDAEAAKGARDLALATVARAARLGLVTPDVYRAHLTRAGYKPEEIAIEMALLVTEIADMRAAQTKRDDLERQAQTRGLSLAQVEHAVKLGAATIDDYRARAASLNYPAAAIATLIAVLDEELQAQADAQARHDQIASELTARHLSLAQLDAAVAAGRKSFAAYAADLRALGYAEEDTQLLVALLAGRLDAANAAA